MKKAVTYYLKFPPGQQREATQYILKLAKQHFPDADCEAFVLADMHNMFNAPLTRVFNALNAVMLAIIALVAIGLYAISAIAIASRSREVGIRKAIGATTNRITAALLWDQSKPILISLLLACPAGFILSHYILQYFPTPIELAIWMLFAVAGTVLAVGLLAIYSHTIKTSKSDPARVLRAE